MKVVIVGAGAVGTQLARQLISEKRDVVLIEKNPDVARQASSALDCMVLTGEGTNYDVLKQAGTESAEFFVAAADSDEVNMIACGIVSSEFELPAKIARVRSFDYHSIRLSEKRFLGIDYVVNPEIEAARAILLAVRTGAMSDVISFEQSRVQIRNVVVEKNGILDGRAMKDLPHILHEPALVAVIIRGNRYLIPSGDVRSEAGDILYLVAREEDFDGVFRALGKAPQALKRVIIVGGGTIGRNIAKRLIGKSLIDESRRSLFGRISGMVPSRDKRLIKIVERDYERCKELSQEFPNALVIHSDVAAEGVFEEQHFSNSDLIIAATDNQELNIVTGLYAKSLGVKRSVALVNRAGYAPIAAQLGIDVPVSKKNAMVTTILRFIRSGVVQSVHTISDGQIEATELTVPETGRAVNLAVKDLGLPRDSLIVSMEREGTSIVPGGSTLVCAGDHLILISKKEYAGRIQEIFKG
ncbi:MAG: Trk system potassium transport protein TrkA [Spirochaetaceae bacterium]|nr:MAG: Trk system potassium transport protein TrkA [Spirochaetaceae bacterium]